MTTRKQDAARIAALTGGVAALRAEADELAQRAFALSADLGTLAVKLANLAPDTNPNGITIGHVVERPEEGDRRLAGGL